MLQEAQSILPVTDIDAAKASLRTIQEKWDAAARSPSPTSTGWRRALRRIESAVREADDKRWSQTTGLAAPGLQRVVDRLEASVASLREDLAGAEASGNEKKGYDAAGPRLSPGNGLAQSAATSTSSAAERGDFRPCSPRPWCR